MDDSGTIEDGKSCGDDDADIGYGIRAACGSDSAPHACTLVPARVQSTDLPKPDFTTSCEKAILIADNDPGRLRCMVEFLQGQGHPCATAGNLTSALALLRTCRYSLFVCEVRIGGQAGLRLLGSLLRTRPHLPMILTTGSTTWDSAEEVFRRGATELLLTQHYLDRFGRVLSMNISTRIQHSRAPAIHRAGVFSANP